jgi:HSP20 family protein
MAHVKFIRNPFEKSFNNLMDDLFSELPVINKNNGGQGWNGFVPVNIQETDGSYLIDVVAPGFDKADFKVNVDQDVLTVSAEKKEEPKEEGQAKDAKRQIRKEYSYRSFKRSFTLDEKIDANGIEAKYVNGVLALNLPKKTEVKTPAQEITIQ